MTTQLRDIRPGEVSLVRRGANRRRFLLAKAETGDVDRDLVTILAAPATGEAELLDVVRKSGGDETVEKAAAAVARITGALREAYGDGGIPAEVLKAMTDGAVDEDDLDLDNENFEDDEDVDLAKADVHAGEEIFKADFTEMQRHQMVKTGEALPSGSYPIPNRDYLQRAIRAVGRGKNNTHAVIRKHIVERARALGATDLLPISWNVKKEETVTETAHAVPVKKEDGTWDLTAVPEEQRPALELVLKSHDDELAELRQKTDAEKSEAIAKAESAEKIAKEERDRRETREFIAKAEELDQIAQDPAEFGQVLKAIAHAERDGHIEAGTSEKLANVLKAANEAVEKGALFAELGRPGAIGGGDAQTKLEAAAAELRKADPGLTEAQSIAKALDAAPDLYTEIQKESV